MKTKAWATHAANKPLEPFEFDRRDPGPLDVAIDILFAGICHSDIHQARNEWGGSQFPMVPGHEIIGRVTAVGAKVTKFKVGDVAGVGCMVDSCRVCASCTQGDEQFCEKGAAWTYNGTEMDRTTRTHGGYARSVVVTESFVFQIPPHLALEGVAPLLCAGITTYAPLREWNCKKGARVAVVGLGGLGHMAVKLAAAMEAEVTMLSTSPSKQADAERLGATAFALTSDDSTFKKMNNYFDLIINTISVSHDINKYLSLLHSRGAMAIVGAPPTPYQLHPMSLISGNRRLAGSLIGGLKLTQEMLDFCGKSP